MKVSKYNRNHISFIVEEIIKFIKSLFIFIFLSLTKLDDGGIYGIIAIIVLAIVSSLLKWITTGFLIDNNELLYYTGLINKKKLEIPLDKINTIDINKNIIDRLFNICTFKIDTGAMQEVGQEIKIKIPEKYANEIRNSINKVNNEKIDDTVEKSDIEKKSIISKTISFKEILIYSLSKSKVFWAFGGIFLMIDFIEKLEEMLDLSITNEIVNNIEVESLISVGLLKAIGLGLLLFIIIYLFISIMFMIFEMVRLYNFTVAEYKNDIKIKYGLFTVKEYSIPRDKIYAVRLKQNLFQQLFKIFQIEVVTVGYGDEKNEQAILYPVADKKIINETLRYILPEFKICKDINKPPKEAISRFILKRNIVLIILLIIPLLIIIPNKFLLLKIFMSSSAIILNILFGYLNYRNTSLGVNNELLVASSGGIHKVTTLIKQEFLQSIEIEDNPFQRKKALCDFKLDIYSNKLGDIVKIKNMKKNLSVIIEGNLIL